VDWDYRQRIFSQWIALLPNYRFPCKIDSFGVQRWTRFKSISRENISISRSIRGQFRPYDRSQLCDDESRQLVSAKSRDDRREGSSFLLFHQNLTLRKYETSFSRRCRYCGRPLLYEVQLLRTIAKSRLYSSCASSLLSPFSIELHPAILCTRFTANQAFTFVYYRHEKPTRSVS